MAQDGRRRYMGGDRLGGYVKTLPKHWNRSGRYRSSSHFYGIERGEP